MRKKSCMRNKIILLGILGVLFTSCGDNFLDLSSKTSLTDEIYYKNQADMEAAVNAVYAPLRELYTGTRPVSEAANAAYMMAEMHSDNTRYILNPEFRATTNQEQVADFIHLASNSVSTFRYQQTYSIIAAANKVLATVDGAEFDDESARDNVKGQALCLRAFSYFDLVQYFGSVPLHLEPVVTMGGAALPLSPVEDVYARIIADLNQIIDDDLLPVRRNQPVLGRVTKGTAQMILANVYMVQKDYALAEILLREIVSSGEYMLMANYADIFDPAFKNNSESIFEIQYRQGNDGYSSTFSYGMLPYPLDQSTVAELTGVSDPQPLASIDGEAFDVPTPDLITAYEAEDLRFDASIGYVADSHGTVFPFCKKYLHHHLQFELSDDNWPVYRYAEVLLLLAEAINEQGKSVSEALSYLNEPVGSSPVSIRGRAGLDPIIAGSQEELREAIAHERRIELAFENKRWLDLVRTGKAVEAITAYGARVKADPSAYYFPAGYAPSASAFSQIDLLWPLPAAEALYSPYF
jgi:tetratricopeptide (TPR) repeat protein